VSAKRDVAIKIRDATLIRIRAEGKFKHAQNFGPLLSWAAPKTSRCQIRMSLRTPFQKLPLQPPKMVWQAALLGHPSPTQLSLPWGLDIWSPRKVLNIEWDEVTGRIDLVSFRRGEWEKEVLSWVH
jgi:hypothetical protein